MKTALIVLLFPLLLPKASITPEHLKVYKGEWQGTLTYLNYGDDETLVNLPVKMIATFDQEALAFDYFYNEGNGQTEKRTGKLELRGEQVFYNGNWDLADAAATDLETWTMTLTSEGKDNRKKASFRMVVDVSPDRIEVTKWVRYKKATGDYFMRNRHIFER